MGAINRIEIPFVGGHSKSRSKSVNNQRLVNMYTERQQQGAKKNVVTYPTPGKTFLFSAGTGPCRSNGIVFNSKAYFVSGADLVSIDNNLVSTSVATLNTNNGWVEMSANPNHMIIVDGTNGYTFDGTTLTTISDPDFPRCNHVTFMDSRFIVEDRDNVGRFYISGINDGTAWATLEFATAESNPDDMFVAKAINNRIYMFGSDTTEPYYNSTDADFPYDPVRNGRIEWVVQAENAVVKAGHDLFWLARNSEGANIFMRTGASGTKVISTRDIENELDGFSLTSDCVGYSYQQLGHTFVVFSFPAADRTLVYDITENEWHDRKSKNSGREKVQGHVYFQEKHIVGDKSSSNFYELDLDNYTDDGDYIERTRYTQYVHKNRKQIRIYELEIEFQPGVGLTTGQGSDPMAMLQVSKDGGNTWSNKLWRSIGKKGEYKNRARWHKLGSARQWLFKVSVTDPVFTAIIAGYANIGEGVH